MAKIAFTDVGLRSLTAPPKGQISYWDEKLPSFGCRISQGGTKTFVLNRKNSFFTIGRFPTISLSQARTEAKRLLAEFTLGKVRPQSITYSEAVKLFLDEKTRARRGSTVSAYKGLLNSGNS
jgi:Arm DNA-binding domain